MNGVEQSGFLSIGNANQFLVQCNWNWGFLTEFRHLFPLTLPDGLLDGMNVKSRKLLQFSCSFLWRKCPVGIYPQFNGLAVESFSDGAQNVQFGIEVNSANFHF